jgi:hypothetical protein
VTTLINRATELLLRPASPPAAAPGFLVIGGGPGLGIGGGFGLGAGGLWAAVAPGPDLPGTHEAFRVTDGGGTDFHVSDGAGGDEIFGVLK